MEHRGEHVVVFVHGRDRPGIVAGISTVLASVNANIIDISQTVLRGMFTMVMIVDISGATVPIETLRRLLEEEAEKLGVEVSVHHIDVVRYMQRP